MTIDRIEVRDLHFSFGEKVIFEDLNVQLNPGFSHLTSGLGSGKSTLLKMLVGLLSPDQGKILYNDQDVSGFSFEEWASLRLRIGYSFDFGGLLNNRTLFENLLLPLHYHNALSYDEAILRVEELLEKFDLIKEKDLRPSEVTGSQKKAACVARSLVLHPEVLLLDDPTIGLKSATREALFSEVEEHMSKRNLKLVISASDDVELLDRFKGPCIQGVAA